MSRRKPQGIGPLREWIAPDGEEWVALQPLYGGLGHFYAPDKSAWKESGSVSTGSRRSPSGERRLPDEVAEVMLEWDREQRMNGCPDENIVQLVELLRSQWAS